MAKNIAAAPWAWRTSDQGDQPGSHNQPLIIKAKLSSLENSPHQAVFSSTAACVHASVCLCVFACAALRCAAPCATSSLSKLFRSPCPRARRIWTRAARHVFPQYSAHAGAPDGAGRLATSPHSTTRMQVSLYVCRPSGCTSLTARARGGQPPPEHSSISALLHRSTPP